MLAIRGIYDGKQIKPLEKFKIHPNVKVIITFLEGNSLQKPLATTKKTKELLALGGTWKDNRPIEEMIREIYESRTVNMEDMQL